jgi:benzoate membrane transport protein
MAGLAFIGALISAVKEIAAGPLVYGPIIAFAIALSNMTVFGLNQFFWSLVLGTAVSLFVERDGWRQLREARNPNALTD